jgi:hypothetical protein
MLSVIPRVQFIRSVCLVAGIILGSALVFAIPASAQTFRGTILGTATDPNGLVVPGVAVTAKNSNTGLSRTAITDDSGNYTIPELPVGTYEVTALGAGFQSDRITSISVTVAAEKRVDLALRVQSNAEVVEIAAEAQVETTSTTLGGTINQKAVADLPINGRDFTKFLVMVPGSNADPSGATDSPGSFGLFSSNGNRGRANNYLLDGTDMNDGYRNLPAINEAGVFGTPATILPIEAIQEVAVLSNFEPEYGRNAGAVVNIVTKSGTNNSTVRVSSSCATIGSTRGIISTPTINHRPSFVIISSAFLWEGRS